MSAEQQAIVAEVLAALEADRLDLPVLPDIASKVQNLINDPDSSIGQFVQLLSTDLSISLYLIKAANTAVLSNGHYVGNLYDAIPRLGYRALYSLVMNIILTKLFRAKNLPINQKLKELWNQCQKVAANSYVLAQQHKHLKPEDAMLIGLVHEIGTLPLCLYADRHYPRINAKSLEVLISTFSAPISFQLLQSWNFPEELVDVVADKVSLLSANETDTPNYVDVVTMANLLTQGATKPIIWKNVIAAERLGYYPSDCKSFFSNHAEQFAVVNAMLQTA